MATKRAMLLLGVASCLLLLLDVRESRAEEATEPLSFDFSIILPDLPVTFGWSPDGKLLAVSQWNKLRARLIDVEAKKLTDTMLPTESMDPQIAWSPNGKYVAFNEPGGFNGVKLVEAHTWNVLGTRNRLNSPPCQLQSHSHPFGFSSDSAALWIGCTHLHLKAAKDATTKYLAAIRLGVPSFNLEEQVMLDAPVRNATTTIWDDTYSNEEAGPVVASVIITQAEDAPKDQLGVAHSKYFVRVFTPINGATKYHDVGLVANPNYWRSITKAIAWPERGLVAVFWAAPQWPLTVSDSDIDPRTIPTIEIYSLDSGARTASYAQQTEVGAGVLHDIALAQRRGLLICGISNLPQGRGQVIVFDAITGRKLQTIETQAASWVGLSPDENRLVVVGLDEVRFFRVN